MTGVLLCCSVHQAHRGAPLAGVLLCSSTHQALKGAPWVGSYSVVQCVRCLMGQPLYCSAADTGKWGQRGYGDGSTPSVLPSMAAWLSSIGISHHDLLPHISLICLSTVNSSPHTGIAPQSLTSSSQLLPLPGDLSSCPAYVRLWQGLSDSHSIQTATDQLFHSQP